MKRFVPLHTRVIAKLVDFVIIFMLLFIVSFLFTRLDKIQMTGLSLLFILLSDGYQGQSVGKKLMRLRVIDIRTRQPTGVVISIIRNLIFLTNIFVLPLIFNYMLYKKTTERLAIW